MEPNGRTTPTLPSFVYLLLLLVPLVAVTTTAAAAWVLLWRRKCSSDGGESSSISNLDSFSCSLHLTAQLSDWGRDSLWGCCNEPTPIMGQSWLHTNFTAIVYLCSQESSSLSPCAPPRLRTSTRILTACGRQLNKTHSCDSDQFQKAFLFLFLQQFFFSDPCVVCVAFCVAPALPAIVCNFFSRSIAPPSLPVPFVVH